MLRAAMAGPSAPGPPSRPAAAPCRCRTRSGGAGTSEGWFREGDADRFASSKHWSMVVAPRARNRPRPLPLTHSVDNATAREEDDRPDVAAQTAHHRTRPWPDRFSFENRWFSTARTFLPTAISGSQPSSLSSHRGGASMGPGV